MHSSEACEEGPENYVAAAAVAALPRKTRRARTNLATLLELFCRKRHHPHTTLHNRAAESPRLRQVMISKETRRT